MARNGWEHYELEKEMANATIFELLEIYRREKVILTDLCVEFVQIPEGEYKIQFNDRCNLQREGVQKVAIKIADTMTNVPKK